MTSRHFIPKKIAISWWKKSTYSDNYIKNTINNIDLTANEFLKYEKNIIGKSCILFSKWFSIYYSQKIQGLVFFTDIYNINKNICNKIDADPLTMSVQKILITRYIEKVLDSNSKKALDPKDIIIVSFYITQTILYDEPLSKKCWNKITNYDKLLNNSFTFLEVINYNIYFKNEEVLTEDLPENLGLPEEKIKEYFLIEIV